MQDELSFTLFNESMNPLSLLTYGVTSKKKVGLSGLPIPWAAGAGPPCLPCRELGPGVPGKDKVFWW